VLLIPFPRQRLYTDVVPGAGRRSSLVGFTLALTVWAQVPDAWWRLDAFTASSAPGARRLAPPRFSSPSAAQPAAPPAGRPPFAVWLAELREEAISRGIREDILEQALKDVDEPLPVVLERDRSQAEHVLTLETYVARRLTPAFIRTARQMSAQHRTVLDEVSARYGVAKPVIVALWGVESNFGRFTGVRPTVAALATLAWDPRRATLFRRELFSALEILNRGDIEVGQLKGSWAGAMGQPQFMPSSYLQFAEDFDGDGRRDIWGTRADVFASMANYLKGHGWTDGERWGREVQVSAEARRRIETGVARRAGTCQASRDMSEPLPLAEWQKLGVRTADRKALPKADQAAGLVSGARRQFLVYRNYDALLAYNCSHAYALSVALLADRIS
jgi:membrane-bound lytic murein transglycosylase B